MGNLMWRCGAVELDLAMKPLVMGVLNVTPDSFSDGGQFLARETALHQAQAMLRDGADILDIGGESTRPGATPVSQDDEVSRVLPVIESLAGAGRLLSIDTMKPEVAWRAVQAGASIINDVSGFRDPEMIRLATECDAGLVVMHMPGTPLTMNVSPNYSDIVSEVFGYLREQTSRLLTAGVARERIAIDPGIGFGKFTEHSLTILANLEAFRALGFPIVLGVSRKGFLGRITGREVGERMPAGLAVASFALALGVADVLRVHDVGPTVDAVKMHVAMQKYRQPFHRDSL
ncbi:MAG: dihydropteroate synthase [Fimbriiglobus sp.]